VSVKKVIIRYLSRNNFKTILLQQQGVSLLTAIMALLILSALGLGIISIVNVESQIGLNMVNLSESLYIAEAGIERGIRAIRDDTSALAQTNNPAAYGYHGLSTINGSNIDEGYSHWDHDHHWHSHSDCDPDEVLTRGEDDCEMADGDYVDVYNFDEVMVINLMGSRIDRIEVGSRFRNDDDHGPLEIRYTVNNWATTGATRADWVWDSSDWTTMYLNITEDRAWDWETINTSNFKIRASIDDHEDVEYDIDHLFIRVRWEIDASTEPWYSTWRNLDDSGSPITVSLPLGNGEVEIMPVYDEAGKVHLNYATQTLLGSLFEKCGIPGGDANTLAANTVSYRSTNWFDSIEEVKQVAGMTDSYYDLIEDYITVYAWANTAVQRSAGARAPININTAPRKVLEAIFEPLGLSAGDDVRLATDILNRRSTAPFTCMDSKDSSVTTDFEDFVDNRWYLSWWSEERKVMENADASGKDWGASFNNVVTTEFCFSSNAFAVIATGTAENTTATVKRVAEDDGTFAITANWGPTLTCWRDLTP
jgi:hypothetical protein